MAIQDAGEASATAERAAAEGGVVGNSRLTAATGTLLTVLLMIEGFTILNVRGYITLHAAIGLILIGPVLLKSASTVYRFTRYYSGRAAYVRKGPPHIVLRLLGPLVLLSTLAVLGTGLVLLGDKGSSGTWVSLHQASFIVWIAVTTVHFLGHLREAAVETAHEVTPALRDAGSRGRTIRLLAVGLSLIVGLGLAAAFTPSASSWHMHHPDFRNGQFHQH